MKIILYPRGDVNFLPGGVGVRFRPVAERFALRGPLPLVKCVAVWMPMLTHVQASHTDALKTHSLQIFLPQDWKTKSGQRPRRENDIGVVPALRGDSRTGRTLFSIAVILPKPFHGMSTKTQVSGMRLMHADTSAPLL